MNQPASIAQLQQQAQAAFQADDLRAAELACRALLRLDPLHSQAHLMMAALQARRDQHRLACHHALQAAQRMGPQPLQHIAAVTLRLIAVGEYERAVQLIGQLDPAQLRPAPWLVEFAQQLSLMEEHDTALRFVDQAFAAGLRSEGASYLRGNLLQFLGRMDESAAEYERCLAMNPNYPHAHWALAYLGSDGGSAARVQRVRAAIAATAPGHADLPYLQYALFKELDGLGEVDGAWQALSAGARQRRSQLQFDSAAEAALFERLKRATGDGFLPGAPADPAQPVPVFVLGLPRTGTTLLERILGGNGQVRLCGELNDLRMQLKWCCDHHSLGFLDAATIDRLGSIDFGQLGRRYLEHVSWRAPGAHVFSDKNPGNYMLAGLILKALPQAKILHLRRNPMDSCFSNMKELFAGNAHPYSYDFADLAAHFDNYSRLMAHWQALAPGRILDVHYEDLVREPAAQAQRVMAFCGLRYDDSQVRVEAHAAPVSTASSAQVRQPIHTRNVGGWRRYGEQLAPLRALLEAAGYETAAAR